MLGDQSFELLGPVKPLVGIDVSIEHPQAARGSTAHADHGVGVVPPPILDLLDVSGCVVEAVLCDRALVVCPARKDPNSTTGVVERGREHVRHFKSSHQYRCKFFQACLVALDTVGPVVYGSSCW